MMKRAQSVVRLLVPLLFASALSTAGAFASPQSKDLGTIGGQVFSPTGFAVPGARVVLQSADGSSPHTTVTDSRGRFEFPMLLPGLYDVRASAQGRSSEWRQNVGVSTKQPTMVTLHLRTKKPGAVKAPASLKKP